MIERIAAKKLSQLANDFKLVSLTGPRQTGKTTLVKSVFKEKPYVNLENPDMRRYAVEDPRGFLDTYSDGAILDEVQRTPELFSYLQENIDTSTQKGKYILTGSNNFLLQQSISQSLAGRIGSMVLLPFSLSELSLQCENCSNDELILNGFYPPVLDQKIPYQDWYPAYLRTYIEKDVRQIKNINDLIVFERFMRLLAGRCSQELNMSALSVETGVDVKTIQSWIGILESSYVIFLLRPHHKNFNKTIVKRPKVYFCDTAIACSLLSINSFNHLDTHPARGALFENMVVMEFLKHRLNIGQQSNIFYWRDKTGHEVDLIVENDGVLLPIEIKSGKTINSDFFKNLKYWKKLSGVNNSILLYAGDNYQKRSDGTEVINWKTYLTKSNT